MDWVLDIYNYKPCNEQEEKDKEAILEFIKNNDNVLLRENKTAHITSSAFVLNKERDKTLMIHHNIYNSWAWTGGHSDGDSNLYKVSLKELKEETGVLGRKNILGKENIASIDILPVFGHIKNGKYVSAHLHLSIAYLIEANEEDKLSIKEDENSNVKWINIKDLESVIKDEPHMKYVYNKILDKLR